MLNRYSSLPTTVRQTGFTLVELLVAGAISIIVVGAIISLMSNSLRASNDTIQSSRLTQDLRSTMQIVSRDVRRAGYSLNAINTVAAGVQNNPYIDVTLADFDGAAGSDCIIFALDRDPTDGGPQAIDWSGVRRNTVNGVGIVEVKTVGAAGQGCNAGTWVPITDPDVVDITALDFDNADQFTVVVSTDPDTGAEDQITVRDITIQLTGQLVGQAATERVVTDSVRVRNDLFVANVAVP